MAFHSRCPMTWTNASRYYPNWKPEPTTYSNTQNGIRRAKRGSGKDVGEIVTLFLIFCPRGSNCLHASCGLLR
jgi:hypothetical protein